MKVILKEPEQKQKKVDIGKVDLKNIYQLIKCDTVERYSFIKELEYHNIDVLVDEEIKFKEDAKPNIIICTSEPHLKILNVLLGNVLFVGVDKNNKWIGLNKEQMDIVNNLLNKFIIPEPKLNVIFTELKDIFI